jgi:hypothetical protein
MLSLKYPTAAGALAHAGKLAGQHLFPHRFSDSWQPNPRAGRKPQAR